MTSQKNSNRKYVSFALGTALTTAIAFSVITACSDNQAKAKPNFVFKDAPAQGVVAKIGGETITEEELIGDDRLDFFDLKKREYELKMDRLNKLMVDRLIGAEAKKANLSTEEYIKKNVTKGEIKISDKDYKKFVEEKKIPESQINPQIKERILSFLKTQKEQDLLTSYIAKKTRGNPVEVYFTKPKLNVDVQVGESPVFGKKDAAVTIVEFSDFQCPFCGRAAKTMSELKKKYGSKVQVAFKHFPLPMHKEAKPASEASMCINEQDPKKFWKFYEIVFENQDKLDNASIEKYAKDVGADMAKFKTCFDGKKYEEFVEADLKYGEKLGVRSTPTFFINGQLVSGAVPLETFAEIIDEELTTKKN